MAVRRSRPDADLALILASISATSCLLRCGRRTATRDGTANTRARTVRSTPAHFANDGGFDQFAAQLGGLDLGEIDNGEIGLRGGEPPGIMAQTPQDK
jgi:hypothetical protein